MFVVRLPIPLTSSTAYYYYYYYDDDDDADDNVRNYYYYCYSILLKDSTPGWLIDHFCFVTFGHSGAQP